MAEQPTWGLVYQALVELDFPDDEAVELAPDLAAAVLELCADGSSKFPFAGIDPWKG